ncbi:DUF1566 domain-containing protein [Herbaspirillum robiniae]|uniref:DUF1566 domain-containing protein n=1 Tax=Herbaspirillum robiniae TaxID=2014887 RepID=UPI001EDAE448|nr:DUF1566 domain-containing protein [Herbaspirillum robiniae]
MNVSQHKAAFLASILKEGEHYAGILLGKDGHPDQHIILLPGDVEKDWEGSKSWAKSIGGELPNRREQSLLIANLKGEFKATWYWSSEPSGDGWAWCQSFSYGSQSIHHTGNALRARAVRRIIV